MINTRLIITPERFHFARWEIEEYKKHFKEVIEVQKLYRVLKENDVLLCYAFPAFEEFQNAKCRAKFCMLYPGWRFNPWNRGTAIIKAKTIARKYNAVFVNEGPVWERVKDDPKFVLVPYSAAHKFFTKYRKRTEFKKIIQVARTSAYKGRDISEAAMKMMPYEWALYPPQSEEYFHVKTKSGYPIEWCQLPTIYQEADGFLSPNKIGPPFKYEVDAKYNQSTMEAGLSGCLIFWHDAMGVGNSFESVLEISLNPQEISQKIQDIVSSIDLDKHSTLTAQEFYKKCNAESVTKAKVDIMKRFL